jgi:cephalosporin hydroxylase
MQEGIMRQTTYFGVRALTSPMDAWVYQEIIVETKPDVIVEIGNADGGGALFLAHLCDLLGHGRVIGIDVSQKQIPESVKKHPRVSFIEADASQVFDQVAGMISADERVMVIEDSSHTYENTLDLLRLYSRLIKPGDYFIVEDSIIQHGITFGEKNGPYEAIETFVKEQSDFEIDRGREHFLVTWNPKGYLKRTKATGQSPMLKQRKPASKTGPSAREILKLFVPPIVVQAVRKLASPRRSPS